MGDKLKMPTLRFKEFSGEWEEKGIGQVLKIGSGKDYKHLENGDIPVYGTGGLMRFVNDYLYDGESVCIGRKGTIDKPLLLYGKFWTVDTLFYTHSFKDSIPKFLFSIFQKINWKLYNEASGVPSLSKSTIEKIKINLPQKQEQEKIASFLSSIDKKIEQLSKKDELLQSYKKGAMQKIFSQEIRFKADDGSDYSDWKIEKLGKYIDLFSGFAFKGNDISDEAEGIPLLRGINITEGKIRHSKEIDRFYNGKLDKLEKYFVRENDLVISMDGSKVGKNVALITKEDNNTLLVQRVARIRANEYSNINFIYQIIWSKYFIRYVDMVNTSSGIPHISSQQIKDFNFQFPNKREQIKIANFLSSIDTKISQNKKALEETKKFKKALLQQMFV